MQTTETESTSNIELEEKKDDATLPVNKDKKRTVRFRYFKVHYNKNFPLF
jgi:hypothetical protein